MLQVFESHCEHLSPQLLEEFALPYIKEIRDRVRATVDVPMVMEARCNLENVCSCGFFRSVFSRKVDTLLSNS